MSIFKKHLIIGATGKTGLRVYSQLKYRGLNPTGASRNSEVRFDWNNSATWAPALNGIEAIYLTYYPDLALPKAPQDISKFCTLARIKGVKQITMLSGRGEPKAQECEKILQHSGLDWTIIRASWFNQNFTEGLFNQFIQDRKIELPVATVGEPFVDIDDIAEIAVESLTTKKHANKLYEVTGPELLSFESLANKLSDNLNVEVSFKQISLAKFQENLSQAAVEPGAINALTYLFTEVLDGRNAHITDGVQQALGRPAKSFDNFIIDNLGSFGVQA